MVTEKCEKTLTPTPLEVRGLPEGVEAWWHYELPEGIYYWRDAKRVGVRDARTRRSSAIPGESKIVFIQAPPPKSGWYLEDEEFVRYERGTVVATGTLTVTSVPGCGVGIHRPTEKANLLRRFNVDDR